MRWLTVWIEAIIVIGLGLVLLRVVAEDLFWWVLFGSTDQPAGFNEAALDYQRWAMALSGALTVAWMTTLLFVLRHPFARGERWAWTAVVSSMCVWFVLDSVASVALGFGENVILNVLMVVPGLPALWATRPRG